MGLAAGPISRANRMSDDDHQVGGRGWCVSENALRARRGSSRLCVLGAIVVGGAGDVSIKHSELPVMFMMDEFLLTNACQ